MSSDKPKLPRTVSESHTHNALQNDKKYGISKNKAHHLDDIEQYRLAQSHILLKSIEKVNFRALFGRSNKPKIQTNHSR